MYLQNILMVDNMASPAKSIFTRKMEAWQIILYSLFRTLSVRAMNEYDSLK